MNIVLSDIRMLTLEPAVSTANMGMAPRNSGGLFTEKLPEKVDLELQSVDFKELIANLSNPVEPGQSDQLDDNKAQNAWNEFLLTQSPKVSIERDVAIAALPLNVEAGINNQATDTINAAIALPATKLIGESLPTGGEPLPLNLADTESTALLQQTAINIPVEVSQHQLKSTPLIVPTAPALDSLAGEAVAQPVAVAGVPSIATTAVPSENSAMASTTIASEVAPAIASLALPPQTPTDLAKAQQKTGSPVLSQASVAIDGAEGELDVSKLQPGRINSLSDTQVVARNPDLESLAVDPDKLKPVNTEAMTRLLNANPNSAMTKAVLGDSDPNGTGLFEIPVTQLNASNQSSLNPVISPVVSNLDTSALLSFKPPASPLPLPTTMQTMTPSNINSSAEWANGIGERVSWMINQNSNSATIRLDPPSLGQLEIQIKLADDSTLVTIHTQQSQTRELLDAASHRLRDYLQENGYQNVNVEVSLRQDQQQAGNQMQSENSDETAEDFVANGESAKDEDRSNRQLGSNSIVDTFA